MPTTLLYHDVVEGGGFEASGFPGASANLYKLDRGEFERHMAALASLPSGTVGLFNGDERGADPVLLAFDDGGASALTAADIVERHGWRGYFFITAGRVDTPAFLSRAGVVELHRRGHVVGSHSMTHPIPMSMLSRAELLREWRESVDLLSGMIGEAVTCASVPGGFHSRDVAETAVEAGIRLLFNSEPVRSVHEIEGCRVLGRYSIQQGVSAEQAAAIARGDLAPRAQQYVLWNAKKLLKRAGGSQWLRFREAVISRGGRS